MTCVYFIGTAWVSLIKIGVTSNLPARLSDLRCGSPVALELIREFPGSQKDEAKLHRLLSHHRVHGEWFNQHSVAQLLDGAETLQDVIDRAEAQWEAMRKASRNKREAVKALLATKFGCGRHVPSAHHVFNSLIEDPGALDDVFAIYGLLLKPIALLSEADALRGAA